MQPARQLTRRTLLGLAVVAIAGCHKATVTKKQTAPRPDPDASALHTARMGEFVLLASYDAAIRRAPAAQRAALRVARAVHATHLAALPGTRPTTFSIVDSGDLPSALQHSAEQLRRLAASAVFGSNAALLASIGASHQVSASE